MPQLSWSTSPGSAVFPWWRLTPARGPTARPSDLLAGGLGTTGNPSATKLAAAADLILCVGTRLSDFDTGSQSGFQHPDVRFININVCGRDAYKQGALPLLADAREALEALAGAAQEAGIETEPSYRREVVEICRDWEGVCRREVDEHEGEVMLQTQLVRTLQEESRPGDTVIAAAGSPPGDILKFWDATGGAALPPGIRVLVHGLRAAGRSRRPHGGS